MITYKSATTLDELQQILSLQARNLPTVVSEEEQLKEGFVTVHHTYELLKRMNDACAHIIAKDEDFVVGYTLCMHPKFANEIEVLRPMFDKINEVIKAPSSSLEVANENFIVMGQVCVDKAYRGRGVFRKLYETMYREIQPQFKCIITEVDEKNARSLNAHYGVGFKTLVSYTSGGQDWQILGLNCFSKQ